MRKGVFLLFLFAVLFQGNGLFAEDGSAATNDAKKKNDKKISGISYLVEIKIEPESTLTKEQNSARQEQLSKLLQSVSESKRLIEKPPASTLILKRRAQADLTQLNQALRSRGYYSAKLDYNIDNQVSPHMLGFVVRTGPEYKIDQVQLHLPDYHQKKIILPSVHQLQLTAGSVADARSVIAAIDKLVLALKEQAYAYARVEDKKIVVDHQSATMNVDYYLQPGPKVFLQQVQFNGVESVDLPFLSSLIPWQESTPYHPDLLEQAAQNFIDTDLFSTVRVELPGENDLRQRKEILSKENEMELASKTLVILKERKHRSIKSRVAFETDTGIALSAKWTHRNFFGAGEKLSVEGAWTGIGPFLKTDFRKPYFLQQGQAFIAELGFKSEDTDAYKSNSFNISAGIERTIQTGMDISLGLGFRFSDITDKSITEASSDSENFSLIYLPARFRWDYSNDLFDPDGGGKILLQGAPFVDIGSDLRFAKLYGNYIQYYKVMEHPRLILAGRLAMGGILGAESYEIPADERFFAGGGGSIRGYGFQLASPLDKNGDPQGGNALLEFAIETRMGFGNNMGGVAFIDGGASYKKRLFDGSNELRYGAGLGFRYSSPIGPLRADIALPIDPREDIDDPFQLYLSIGHAF